jgi:hypothetical protein
MPRPTNPSDAAAKLEVMNGFFDDASQRVDFLSELDRGGHRTEALTLCLTYIDSFAQWLQYPREGVGQNFVESLCAHEQFTYFSLIHPLQMVRALAAMNGSWPMHSKTIESIFPAPPYELMDRLTFARSLTRVGQNVLQAIQQEFWRGTVASVAYYWLRNPSVHRFGSSPSVSFGSTVYQGTEPPSLGLATLVPTLKSMIKEARTRSTNTCEWFGNDRIMA